MSTPRPADHADGAPRRGGGFAHLPDADLAVPRARGGGDGVADGGAGGGRALCAAPQGGGERAPTARRCGPARGRDGQGARTRGRAGQRGAAVRTAPRDGRRRHRARSTRARLLAAAGAARECRAAWQSSGAGERPVPAESLAARGRRVRHAGAGGGRGRRGGTHRAGSRGHDRDAGACGRAAGRCWTSGPTRSTGSSS